MIAGKGADVGFGPWGILPALLACVPLLGASAKTRPPILHIPVLVDASRVEDGGPAAVLTAKDFSVRLEGEPARIVAVRGPSDDLMVLLVLDWTEDLNQVELAKQSLVEAVQKLPAKAAVGLLNAQDGLHVMLDPTTDRAALVKAIQVQPVSGKAGLLDTVETACRIGDGILAKAAVRLALVYVTDSSISNYRADYINPVINSSDRGDLSRYFPEGLVKDKISKVASKLAGLETPLFIIHLSYRSDRLNEAYQSGLMQLASASGGMSVFCRSRGEIGGAIANTFRTIAGHYSLDVQAPQRSPKILPVELESGGRALSYRSRFVLEER